ncbi:MAG: molybdopterin-dependent oxidoreductase [Flammeovirgaceae bacterium]|nr:molybdopterin-dependent oxidoreductase [Flammeovirgaceae bacterium]
MNKWTRRGFITTGVLASGAVIFGIAIRPGNRAEKVADKIAGPDETMMNIWLKIAKDNTITAIIPHAEMGQGVHTALTMMLAEELDADWGKMKFEEAPADKEYANHILIKGFLVGEAEFPAFLTDSVNGIFLAAGKMANLQITGGSASVRFTGMNAMRVAGASTKIVLLKAAAKAWGVSESELTVEKSIIHHKASGKSGPYAEFAKQATDLCAPIKPQLKAAKDFNFIGKSPARFDIPAKVKGTAKFGIDAELPGMKYATIKAAPVFGNKVKSMDDTEALKMDGVHKILNLGNAVAVVADGYWQAKKAIGLLDIEWEASENTKINQEGIFAQFSKSLDNALSNNEAENDKITGDTEKAISNAGVIVEAEYQIPYLAHATMEPMNCTAWLDNGKCEIWTGSQNPLGFANDVAELLEIDIENVTVHNQLLGGGFGRRSETDVAKQVVRIAKETGVPIKLIWSREEDIQQDFYREANVSRFKAGLDNDGNPMAWKNTFLFKHHPKEAPYIPYDIANQSIKYTTSATHVPWGNWRSVDHSMHGFFTESFIDELAHAAGKNPLAYRKSLLADQPRFLMVLEMAETKSDWEKTLPENFGRGVAIHQSFGTIVAEVVEIEITEESKLKVHKVVCVADPGQVVHTDGFIAQMESGIVYGLTAALYGEIKIENGAVEQSNFHDYKILRMEEMPKIETYIINSGNFPGGAGEPSTPCIAPALANAVFNATGQRIRQLPFKNHKLKKDSLLANKA